MLLLLVSLLPDLVYTLHLLVIGDSLDRYMVAERCAHYSNEGSLLAAWGDKRLKYPSQPQVCRSGTHTSIAQVQVFGANGTGPYRYKHLGEDVWTKSRTLLALSEHLRIGVVPDVVVFHATLWDAYHMNERDGKQQSPFNSVFNNSIHHFDKSMREGAD
jgi:hypothetical protein